VAARFESALGGRTDIPPLSGGSPRVVDASVSAFHAGLEVGGALVILGGIISLVGIVNPRRAAAPVADLGASRLAQPCWQESQRSAA
jgi:hypothetical protein